MKTRSLAYSSRSGKACTDRKHPNVLHLAWLLGGPCPAAIGDRESSCLGVMSPEMLMFDAMTISAQEMQFTQASLKEAIPLKLLDPSQIR